MKQHLQVEVKHFIYVFPIINQLGIGLAVLSYAYRNLGYFYRCLSFFVIATIIFFSLDWEQELM